VLNPMHVPSWCLGSWIIIFKASKRRESYL